MLQIEVFPETIDLVHPLVQDRDDTDIAIGKQAPVDKVALVAEDIALNAKFRRDGA